MVRKIIITIIFIVFVCAGGVGYVFLKKGQDNFTALESPSLSPAKEKPSNPQPIINQEPTPPFLESPSTIPRSPAGWEVYHDAIYKFSIKYPKFYNVRYYNKTEKMNYQTFLRLIAFDNNPLPLEFPVDTDWPGPAVSISIFSLKTNPAPLFLRPQINKLTINGIEMQVLRPRGSNIIVDPDFSGILGASIEVRFIHNQYLIQILGRQDEEERVLQMVSTFTADN